MVGLRGKAALGFPAQQVSIGKGARSGFGESGWGERFGSGLGNASSNITFCNINGLRQWHLFPNSELLKKLVFFGLLAATYLGSFFGGNPLCRGDLPAAVFPSTSIPSLPGGTSPYGSADAAGAICPTTPPFVFSPEQEDIIAPPKGVPEPAASRAPLGRFPNSGSQERASVRAGVSAPLGGSVSPGFPLPSRGFDLPESALPPGGRIACEIALSGGVAPPPEEELPPPKPVDSRWIGTVPPVEAALLADAEDGHLDHYSLFRAALIAGGTLQPEQLHHYEAKFQAWVVELEKQHLLAQPPQQRAETLFRFMHRQILTEGYDQRASNLADTLQTGRYNCLSASLLYQCLLQSFGMEAEGLEMPGHARCRVRIGEEWLDVETTCPQWFELLRNSKTAGPQKTAAPGPSPWRLQPERNLQGGSSAVGPNGISAAPSQTDGAWPSGTAQTPITEVGLVAIIYYNRGVDLLSEGRFREALAANAKALRLAPGHPRAWGNFLATMNNWAVWLGRLGQYAEAAELLRQGLALAPSYKPFQANFLHVHYQWTVGLSKAGRLAEAWQVLAQGASAAPASYRAAFRTMQLDLAKDWTYVYLSQGQPSQALTIWQEVRRHLGNGPDVLEAERAALGALVAGSCQAAKGDGLAPGVQGKGAAGGPRRADHSFPESETAPVSATVPEWP